MLELAFREGPDIFKYYADYLLNDNSCQTVRKRGGGITGVYSTYLLYRALIVMHAVTSRFDKIGC